MRDPGTPGRNPFLGADGAEAGAAPPGAGADAGSAGPLPPDVDALSLLAGMVDALTQAQPEAAEHLVAAAHEVVLAVKTVVDAAEAALAEQRMAMHLRSQAASAPEPEPGAAHFDEPGSRVRRIDLG